MNRKYQPHLVMSSLGSTSAEFSLMSGSVNVFPLSFLSSTVTLSLLCLPDSCLFRSQPRDYFMHYINLG